MRHDAFRLTNAARLRAITDRTHPRPRGALMDFDNLTAAALVAAGQHDDLVAFPDSRRHHSTSGASEMIVM